MSARGIVFEEGHADAVASRLRVAGYRAEVRREPNAGEDDDEDHPWAVLTDAPMFVLELAVEEFDGWVQDDEPPPSTKPFSLPDAPRRIKRDGTS